MKLEPVLDYLDPLPNQKQTDYIDSEFENLSLRVSFGGTRSWYVLFRENGRKRRLKLGKYPIIGLDDARYLAKQVLAGASIENLKFKLKEFTI